MVFTLSGEADMISTCLDECCNRQDVIEFFWTLTEEELGFGVKSKYTLHLVPEYYRIVFFQKPNTLYTYSGP